MPRRQRHDIAQHRQKARVNSTSTPFFAADATVKIVGMFAVKRATSRVCPISWPIW
jgi:hypothetical protein